LWYAREFQKLSDIEEEGIRSGKYKERLSLLNVKYHDLAVHYNILTEYAGRFFCKVTGLDDRIEKFEATRGDVWLILLSCHLDERPGGIGGLFRTSARSVLSAHTPLL
jgi:hypothetical protein